MEIYDTHAHYEDAMFDKDRFEFLDGLVDSEVKFILNCCSDVEVFDTVMEIVNRYDFIYGSIGIHPHWVTSTPDDYLERIRKLVKHKKIVAIGEMGLDYFFDDPKDLQKRIFIEQLELAKELDMPVIIHDRDAHEDCLEILRKYKPVGILHRFGGPVEMVKEVTDWGMYISFNNDLTYPEWNKPHIDCLMATPWDRFLIETDCPYASPSNERERRCDSKDCANVIKEVARLRNVSEEFVEKTAKENALKVYRLEDKL